MHIQKNPINWPVHKRTADNPKKSERDEERAEENSHLKKKKKKTSKGW